MGNFMIALWNMSIQAGLAVLVVLLAREIFRWLRVPKKYAYALWMIPFIRFICPWSFESIFSILPDKSRDVISSRQVTDAVYYVTGTGSNAIQNHPGESTALAGTGGQIPAGTSASALDWTAAALTVAGVIWAVVVLLLVAYSIISYQKLRRRTQCAMRRNDNIYLVDHLDTAFVMGFFHPRICLPSGLSAPEQRFVIAHEQTHIRRRDYWVKLLTFFITCIHWFNPLAWLAFYLMGKDMEMSCDEAVLRQMGRGVRGEYATALLRLTGGNHRLSGVPLAFGEGNTKGRIVHIMRYRKPVMAAAIVAVGVLAILAAALLTNPRSVVKLSEIEELSMALPSGDAAENMDRVILTMDGVETEFPAAYQDIFMEHLMDMKVSKEPADDSLSNLQDVAVELHFMNGGCFYFGEDMTVVWCEEESVSRLYRVHDPEGLQEFLEQQTGSVEDSGNLSYEEVSLTPPTLSQGMVIGSDGVQLDYADENRVIFHDWFGMFVYDIEVKQFVGAVDLEQIGCGDTQGDNACEVRVSADGGTVYLHPAQDEEMYMYRVETNTVTREKYDISGINMFDDFLDTREMVEPDHTMFQSERCVEIDTEEGTCYGLIESAGMIESISFVGYKKGNTEEIFRLNLFSNLSPASEGADFRLAADSRMYFMGVKDGSVTAGGLELQIFNYADEPMIFGADYRLYLLENGNWEEFVHWDSRETQYEHPGGGCMMQVSVDWTGLCGELEPGRYRIAKTASVPAEDDTMEEVELDAEFEVE